jgi:hypothetical protein
LDDVVMMVVKRSLCLTCAAVLVLSACAGSREPDLLTFRRSSEGPDEFTVAPARPLETPPAAALPPPTLGVGTNRADATPEADAIVALGGRPQAATLDGIPGNDAALVRYAGRNGTDPVIRQTLAEEDLEFRRRNDGLILERMTNANIYFDSYAGQSLNQQRELDRLRQRGVATPGAPPEELFPE